MARGRWVRVKDDMPVSQRVVLCASEFFGTAILLFLGCMGCVSGITPFGIPHEQISLTFGLAVMVAIQCFGHVSGAHINPIVTVAAATLGHIPLIQVPVYFTGQFLGAFGGYGLLMAVTSSNLLTTPRGNITVGVCSPAVHPSLSGTQALLVEFTISLILVLVCCAVWDHRNSTKHDSVSIRFGFTIAVLAMAAGPYTGANMNPFRSFAPVVMSGGWDYHWVYWIGPFSAGFFGALLYRVVFNKEDTSKDQGLEAISLNENNKD